MGSRQPVAVFWARKASSIQNRRTEAAEAYRQAVNLAANRAEQDFLKRRLRDMEASQCPSGSIHS
jgi:predicted RNA polymerase sigma factor